MFDVLLEADILLLQFLILNPLLLVVDFDLFTESSLILLLLDLLFHENLHWISLEDVAATTTGLTMHHLRLLQLGETGLDERFLCIGDHGIFVTLFGGIDVRFLRRGFTVCLSLFLKVQSLTLGEGAIQLDTIIMQIAATLLLLHVTLILALHLLFPIFTLRCA